MYAMYASEVSSCRLLLLPLRDRDRVDVGDDDDDDVVVVGCERAAVRKEGRRKRRVTEVKTARMAVLVRWLDGLGWLFDRVGLISLRLRGVLWARCVQGEWEGQHQAPRWRLYIIYKWRVERGKVRPAQTRGT